MIYDLLLMRINILKPKIFDLITNYTIYCDTCLLMVPTS